MRLQIIEYPNCGKEVLLIISAWAGIKGWQRQSEGVDWEKIDVKSLDNTPVPRNTEVVQKTIY